MDSELAGKGLGAFALYCCEPRTPTSLHQSLILKFAHIGRSAPSTADSWKRPVIAQNCETSRKTQDFPAPCHTFERHDSVVVSLVSLRRRGRASLGA
jgi:hypothetical protein